MVTQLSLGVENGNGPLGEKEREGDVGRRRGKEEKEGTSGEMLQLGLIIISI